MASVVIVVIAQEFSPPTRRDMSTDIVMLRFPLGSTLAGGMPGDELDELTARLAPAQAARAEQRRWHQRRGRRRNAPGAGGRRLLSDAAALLITVVYLR